MSASHVQVVPDSTGKDIDADSLTSSEAGTPTVYRQVTVIGDPSTYANKATVTASGAVKVDGSAVTQPTSLAAQPGAVNSANSQVTASGSAATLAVARATRRRLLVKNTDTSLTFYVGAATVTSANGMPLLPGESVELRGQILYQIIASSGSPVAAIVDEYD
jgi:hypothetical protein